MEASSGPIDGVSFDTRLSLVDNIATLVTKEKQVLLLQLEEKTRALELLQQQLSTVQHQYHKLETYVSDQNEDTSTAWQRASKQSSQSKRNALAKQWFAGSNIKGRSAGPHNDTQNSVNTLILSHQKLEPTQLTTLRKQIPLLPQMTSLDLTNTNLTDDDAPAIVDFFNPKCGLQEIVLKNNRIDEKCLKAIASALKSKAISGKQIVQLKRLDLSHNPFAKHPKMGTLLGDALKTNTTLRSLAVTLDDVATLRQTRGSSYLGNTTQFLLSMFHSPTVKNTTLQELTLVGATLSLKTMEAFGRARGLCFKSLTSLDMSTSLIGPQGCFELVNSITNVRPRKECALKTLKLRGNALGDQGACELAYLLRHNRTLTELDVRGNQITEKGAVALGSALENDSVLGVHHGHPHRDGQNNKKGNHRATSRQSRMSDRRRTGGGSSSAAVQAVQVRRMPHVLRTLLLGDNALGQHGGEALLDACRKCMSLHCLGELSPTVPAALRQELVRVLRENIIESRGTQSHCGVVAFGQSSVLKEGRIVVNDQDRENKNGGETKEAKGEEDGAEGEEGGKDGDYPRPCIHTYPWVVETKVPALRSATGSTKKEDSGDLTGGNRNAASIDWTGWHRHYNVYLYRTSPATWKDRDEEAGDRDEGEGEDQEDSDTKNSKSSKSSKSNTYRGLDIEFEGFATCTTDPLHRLALDGGDSGSRGKGSSGGRMGAAPRTTSLCYRIVRQTSNNDLPHPGLVVQEDVEERDQEDGLLYSLRLRPKDTFRAGDRLSVWIKPMSVSSTETAHLYTRNFYLRLPTDEWDMDYDDAVLHDQTFHQLNLWNGDRPFM